MKIKVHKAALLWYQNTVFRHPAHALLGYRGLKGIFSLDSCSLPEALPRTIAPQKG